MKKDMAPFPKPAPNIHIGLSVFLFFLFFKKYFEISAKLENGYNNTPILQLSQLSMTHMTKLKKTLKVRRYQTWQHPPPWLKLALTVAP